MARTRRNVPKEPQPESVVAAATRLSGTPTPTSMSGRSGAQWQEECWRFYDTIGEYRYACDWIASVISRAVLYATHFDAKGAPVKQTEGSAYEIISALFGSADGRRSMLQQIGVHFSVAGECYLVGIDEQDEEEWYVVASGEMKKSGGKWKIGSRELDDPLVIRLWDPHPRKHGQANSPSRAVLPILREIEGLTKHVAAQVDSRLTSAGILFMPKEITFPVPPQAEGADPLPHADGFSQMLTMAMKQAIQDRDSASAMVPIIVTVPGEHLEKAHHLKFWSDLDEQAIKLREEAIRRLALGMNIPPEVLTGMSDANHWSAWQVDESAIKAHAEPMLHLITSSLAKGYLRPLLTDEGETDPGSYGIGADTSEMRLRPNRSKEALELYDRGELDSTALRRETGFHDDSALEGDEMKSWVLRQIASGRVSATPAQVAWALSTLTGMDVPADDPAAERGPQETPSLEEHPTRDLPEQAALLAASEVLVYRALERAGNRMRSHKAVDKEACSAADAYLVATKDLSADMLLEDAWSCVERTTASLCTDTAGLTRALDSYTRVLLTERKPHDRRLLGNYLSLLLEA